MSHECIALNAGDRPCGSYDVSIDTSSSEDTNSRRLFDLGFSE